MEPSRSPGNPPGQAVEKFASTTIWEFMRALNSAISKLNIETVVPEAYDLSYALVVAVYTEQKNARDFLQKQQKK
jgi:hypothetical protein